MTVPGHLCIQRFIVSGSNGQENTVKIILRVGAVMALAAVIGSQLFQLGVDLRGDYPQIGPGFLQ